MATAPFAVSSPYDLPSRPNSVITLHRGRMDFSDGTTSLSGAGRIFYQWLPRTEVAFRTNVPVLPSGVREARLSIPSKRMSGTYFSTDVRLAVGGVSYSRGFLNAPLSSRPSAALTSVVFHLPNFPNYLGTVIRNADGAWWRGRLELNAGPWTVVVDALRDVAQRTEAVRNEGGFVMTHVGRLSRSDGGTFSPDEAAAPIDAFGHLASFTRGAWSHPTLLVGRDASGNTVWEEWYGERATAWRPIPSWFNLGDSGSLTRAFPEMWRLWSHQDWQPLVSRVVYTYLAANTPAVDTGLLLSQAGLEMLAYGVLVLRTKKNTPKQFNDLTAAAQTRQLLRWARLPTKVPRSLSFLATYTTPGATFGDGPERLTFVRNRFAHPPKGGVAAQPPPQAYVQSWRLAMWYLDASLLRLLRCYGAYASRVGTGTRHVARK